jgi:hypothetical protein
MPTPTGLLKAGDKLIHKDDPSVVYVVQYRTDNSSGFGVYIAREDGKYVQTPQGMRPQLLLLEVRWKLEHPNASGWKVFTPGQSLARDLPGNLGALKSDEFEARLERERTARSQAKPTLPDSGRSEWRNRQIRVAPCRMLLDPSQGREAEITMRDNESQSQSLVLTDVELMDLIIRGLTYLRDKADGTLA